MISGSLKRGRDNDGLASPPQTRKMGRIDSLSTPHRNGDQYSLRTAGNTQTALQSQRVIIEISSESEYNGIEIGQQNGPKGGQYDRLEIGQVPTLFGPNTDSLPFPMIPSTFVKPEDRVLARGAGPTTSVQDIRRAFDVCFVAEPERLTQGLWYFGVRQGRRPGVYYSEEHVRRETQGYQSIWQAFMSAAEVNAYMRHEPADCKYASCSGTCKQALKSGKKAAKTGQSALEDAACDCCGGWNNEAAPLCWKCFADPASWAKKVIEDYGLVPEQASIFRSVAQGRNVFFTGAAGTGKSRLIHAIKKYLQGLNVEVQAVAPSGIAALNVDGRTVSSYASWEANVGRVTIEEICQRAARKNLKKRIVATDVLIIDEISMIESNVLTRLSQLMQAALSKSNTGDSRMPFGGVQVVMAGDFFQLPPVKPLEHCLMCGFELISMGFNRRMCRFHGEFDLDDRYAFASPAWLMGNITKFELKHIHRQEDALFISILQSLRKGLQLTTGERYVLQHHDVDISREDATKLVPLRVEAKRINDWHTSQIPQPVVGFTAIDSLKMLHPEVRDLAARCGSGNGPLLAMEQHRLLFDLELKKDMLVLLISNVNPRKGLVNGSVGRIVEFIDMTEDNMPRAPKQGNSKEKYTGQTLMGEHAEYQAAQVREFRARLPPASRKWPVVQFKNGVKQVIVASCFISERGSGRPFSLLSRTQIPLLPGYAMTIHACQGMTLESVVVDLARCFERGQAYVALSRAKSLKGLIVDSLPSRDLPADPVIEQFMVESFGDEQQYLGNGYYSH